MPKPDDDLRRSPWRWEDFAGAWMLVSDTGEEDVVLQALWGGSVEDGPRLIVRSVTDGRLVDLTPDHPIARLLVKLPDLYEICRLAAGENDPETLRAIAQTLAGQIGEWETVQDAVA